MPSCQPIGDAGAEFEDNRWRALAHRPDPRSRGRKGAARRDRDRKQRGGAASGVRPVIDQPRERAILRHHPQLLVDADQ